MSLGTAGCCKQGGIGWKAASVCYDRSRLGYQAMGKQFGCSPAAAVARAAHLYLDQRVRISVEDNTIVIRPAEDAELTLDQRLAQFDPARHGGEVMQGQPVGAGLW